MSGVQKLVHFHSTLSHWIEGPFQVQGNRFHLLLLSSLVFGFKGEQNKGNLSQTGKVEVVIYGIKDLFQTTVLLYVFACILLTWRLTRDTDKQNREAKNCQRETK